MKRLLGACLALALLLPGGNAEGQKPARMDETGWVAMGAPSSATLGCVGVFLGSPLHLQCDAGISYNAATDTLTTGTLAARNVTAIPLPASGAITVEPKLSPIGGITVVGAGWRASGLLTVIACADIEDGETFVLSDGTHVPQTFEFDNIGDGVVGGHVEIDLVGTETAPEVGAICAAAIDATTSATFTYDAVDNLDGTVTLQNTTWAAAGNTAQSETVADAGFVVTNMTGGVDAGIIDGDYFTIKYSGSGTIPVEFDIGDGTTGGRIPLIFTGTETADDIRDAIITLLNTAAPTQLTASSGGAATVSLVLDTPGATGGAITESVTDAGFSVTDWTDPTHATTYTYSLQACLADGTCNAAGPASTTAAGVATLSAANFNRLTWSAVPGAASYKIRRDVGGATQGVIWSGTATTVDDTGLAGDSSAKPTADRTGGIAGASFWLSDLNTAPASANAACTAGEIRWTATHVYLCSATDTWVRAALATWP